MGNVRGHIVVGNKRYTWISGNELVKKEGEDLVTEEVSGNGYTAQLRRFIEQRDRRLEEEAHAKAQRKEARAPKKARAPEPGDEE